MRVFGEWVLAFVLAASALGLSPAYAAPAKPLDKPETSMLLASAIQLTGPAACPTTGCAAGQRLGMRYEYDLGTAAVGAGPDPNVMVCLYSSTNWGSRDVTVNVTGETDPKLPYSVPPGTKCADVLPTPAGYALLAERVTTVATGRTGDALRFAFRLGDANTGGTTVTGGSGKIIARLFARNGTTWAAVSTGSVDSPSLIMGSPTPGSPVYVANDNANTGCGSNGPCFVNSYGDDRQTGDIGVGTGLKDAVDVIDSGGTITILGTYTIKSSRVLVNKPVIIEGTNDSKITFTEPANADTCKSGMLALEERVTLRNLNIDDGNCSNPNRNLVEINSPAGQNGADDIVLIENNDLTDGKDAIYVRPENNAKIIVRFNHISANSGSALFYQALGGSSELEATANNIFDNGASPPVNCGSNATSVISSRTANHNYWGDNAPAQDATHCTIAESKRLGAPIERNSSGPGVHAALVNVTTTRSSNDDGFDGQIAYYRSGTGGSDFPLYIVDHGYMPPSGPPFIGALYGRDLSPCSNYFDVFLPKGAAGTITNNLELIFQYANRDDGLTACVAAINSSAYCGQSASPGSYPLYWYDPSSEKATVWWDPVGARPENLTTGDGQATSCNTTNHEIQVTIDNNGRPNLTNDMAYLPFMVGIPVIKSYNLYTSSQTVRVEWITNLEPDVEGFNILRGTDPTNLLAINATRINHSGSSTTGFTYNISDNQLVNGTKYYYRVEVVRKDGNSFYSERKEVTVNSATAIPPTLTFTATPIRPTATKTMTTIPTQRPTQMGAVTNTPAVSQTPAPTGLVLATLTPEGEETGLPTVETIQPNRTEIAMVETAEPTRSLTPTRLVAGGVAKPDEGPNRWGSLLLGLLIGLVMIGALGSWWFYAARK